MHLVTFHSFTTLFAIGFDIFVFDYDLTEDLLRGLFLSNSTPEPRAVQDSQRRDTFVSSSDTARKKSNSTIYNVLVFFVFLKKS